MISLFNIRTVARFESKTLFRSWFFRIFAALILGFILMFNLFGITGIADGGWPGRYLPSGAPYFNIWILNIAQAIIAVFLAADFLGRDKKLDTTEAFYVRSMSNSDYVIGKTIGVLKVFILLNVLVVFSAFLFTLIANEVTIPLSSYLYYPLLVSFPTLLLVLGLSFFMMTLLRNQAVTFVLLLGFIALSLFYLRNKYLGLFDVLGFYTPFMRSDFTGFQNIDELISKRLIYVLMGLFFILATIWRLPRLEQQKFNKASLLFGMLLCLSIGGYNLYSLVNASLNTDALRERIVALNQELTESDYRFNNYQLVITHHSKSIECEASMSVVSKGLGSKRLNLALNPGLKVTQCLINDEQVDFVRDAHLLKLNVPDNEGESFELRLFYNGVINDKAMYVDVNDELFYEENRLDPLLAGKQYSFIKDNFLLLTREANWYPLIANKQYWTNIPFVQMDLEVITKPGLMVISQGKRDSLANGTYHFTNEQALNAYSVVVGNFERHTTMVDSVEFNLYHHQNHTAHQSYFTEINDTIADVIKTMKDDFERKLGLEYPFKRFSIVEAPINMYSYLRNWSLTTENIMPEMVLFPENGGGMWQNDWSNVRRRVDRHLERSNEEMSEKEKQVDVLKNYLGDNFISPSRFFFGRRQEGERHVENWGRHQVFPLFFTYTNRIVEDNYPLLTIALENYLHNRLGEARRRDLGGLSSNDEVILKLRNSSLKSLIDKEDVNTLGNVFASKGSQLFSNLKVNVDQSDFDTQLDNYLVSNRFKNQTINQFTVDVSSITNTNFQNVYNNWLNEAFSPAFLFSSADVFEVKDGNRMRYFLKFTVANNGDADGIISITVREGRQQRGGGRFRSRFQGDDEQDNSQSYQIEAGNTFDIGFLLDEEPREVIVNTFLATNIPSNQTIELNGVVRDKRRIDLFEGTRISERKLNYINKNEIIVDNEDEGFSLVNTGESRTVKDWWAAKQNEDDEEDTYGMIRFWNPPVKWKPVAGDQFFGEYLKSAVYKRKGTGEGYLTWQTSISQPGTYDVYAYVPNISFRFGRRRGNSKKEMIYNYTVIHDDGKDAIEVSVDNENNGWLYLGEYYFSEGKTKVQLSDVTNNEYVIGDAVKWIRK